MDAIRAVCECKNMAESDTVLAVKKGRFSFVDSWGTFTWFMVFIMILITGAIWCVFIVGWHFKEILNPKYHCNSCDAVVPSKQFRV